MLRRFLARLARDDKWESIEGEARLVPVGDIPYIRFPDGRVDAKRSARLAHPGRDLDSVLRRAALRRLLRHTG